MNNLPEIPRKRSLSRDLNFDNIYNIVIIIIID